MVARLWYLQILQAAYYDERARRRWVRAVLLKAPRGLILDARNRVMATNVLSYNLCVIPGEFNSENGALPLLSQLAELPPNEIQRRIKEHRFRAFEPVCLREDLPPSAISAVMENLFRLPGVTLEEMPVRIYPHGKLAAHVLGYIGEATASDLQQRKELSLGDRVGRMGLERQYDAVLQGEKGYRLVEVDASGAPVRRLAEVPVHPGKTLLLTLDMDWQRACERALEGHRGAMVVMEVRTGGILALCSLPSFDPNRFCEPMNPDEWRALCNDRARPLQNRAIAGCYPPGSTFKIVTAVAGLSAGIIKPSTQFTCTGAVRIGRRTFRCWRRQGTIDLIRAIGQSCDSYFYQVGMLLKAERLARYAHTFGLGEFTGIDLLGERRGLVPTPRWKRKRFNAPWYGGDTANFSIGQGYLLTTPLQMCLVAAAIANNGVVYQPHLVRSIVTLDGKLVRRTTPTVLTRVPLSTRNRRAVHQGMLWAVYGAGGTASRLRSLPIKVAGKTGSAEHGGGNKPHAWFIGYAPADAPRIAFSIVVEEGGHGGETAVPIVKQVLTEMLHWFTDVRY